MSLGRPRRGMLRTHNNTSCWPVSELVQQRKAATRSVSNAKCQIKLHVSSSVPHLMQMRACNDADRCSIADDDWHGGASQDKIDERFQQCEMHDLFLFFWLDSRAQMRFFPSEGSNNTPCTASPVASAADAMAFASMPWLQAAVVPSCIVSCTCCTALGSVNPGPVAAIQPLPADGK